jgi:hypothetical protein
VCRVDERVDRLDRLVKRAGDGGAALVRHGRPGAQSQQDQDIARRDGERL